MSDPVRPSDAVTAVGERPTASPARPGLPVPLEPAPGAQAGNAAGARPRRAGADYAAHILGQDGRKRGLKGGPETLDAAREAYLRTEYSGPNDRRPRAGLVKRTNV